jgi:hypothetical protein
MAHFLAVSAFRDQSVESVASHTVSYASTYDVACMTAGQGQPNEKMDAIIFAPQNRWTVVLWPVYFNIHDIELCRTLSGGMSSLISTVHVYHDEYWVNAVFDKGTTISLFASDPGHFAQSDEEIERLKVAWSGDANALSQAVSVPREAIEPYFVHLDTENPNQPAKAFPGDVFELWNFWVFTDFWCRHGIHYPNNMANYQERLRFPSRFDRKLPSSDEL